MTKIGLFHTLIIKTTQRDTHNYSSEGKTMAATIISILHTQTPAEMDILSTVSDYLRHTFSHDSPPICTTIEYNDFDRDSLPNLSQFDNPIVLLTGTDSIATIQTLNTKNDCAKCLIWVATESLNEPQHKTALTHADIILKPKCVADSDVYNNAKVLNLEELPHSVNTPNLINIMQERYFQDTVQHTLEMSKPNKTCWNLFFKPEQPTPIAALLGGAALMHSPFNKTTAQDLANCIISKWKGKRFYVVVIADHFTSQECRDAFTLILDLNKTPYVIYDDKRLLPALAYVSQKQGHIVLTEECLWKLTICTHIEKLPEYVDTAIMTENPLQEKNDVEEIIFEPSNDRETQKLHPVPTAPPGKIVPYILRCPRAARSCQEFTSQTIATKNLRVLDKKPLWRDPRITSEESSSTRCDFSKLTDLITSHLPQLRQCQIKPA